MQSAPRWAAPGYHGSKRPSATISTAVTKGGSGKKQWFERRLIPWPGWFARSKSSVVRRARLPIHIEQTPGYQLDKVPVVAAIPFSEQENLA